MHRSLARLVVALVLGAVGAGVGASAASAAASLTVTPNARLAWNDQTLTVSGSGFPTDAPGIYVVFGLASDAGSSNAGDFQVAKFVTNTEIANGSGSFSATLTVDAKFTKGATPVDCSVQQCAVMTMRAHGVADPTGAYATSKNVTFAGPAVTVTPKTGLDPAATTPLTVTGKGFANTGTGIYVAYGPKTADYATDAAAYASVKWIQASQISADTGEFTTTLDAQPTYTDGHATNVDCRVTQCQVITMKAHGVPDRTQDTFTPVLFALADPGAPHVTATPITNLSAADEHEVTITGTGFDPNQNNGGGFYVAFGPADAATSGAGAFGSAKWVRPAATPGPGGDVLNPDGSFSTTLTIKATYGSGASAVDCTVTACAIRTFASQGSAYRGFDTSAPVTFVGDGGGSGSGGGGAFGLAVSPTSGLSTAGPSAVTVSGSGYSASEPGIYLVYGPAAGRANPNAYYAGAQWLHVGGGNLSSTGSFRTTLAVAPTYTDGDGNVVNCTVVQCYVQTMRAHGMSDIDQDFAVPVSFGSTVPTPAPDAAAAQAPAPGTPSQAPAAPTSAGSSGPASAPRLGRLTVAKNGRASLRVTERSTVTFVLRKKVNGTWKVVKVVRVRTAGAGTAGAKLPIGKPGRYRISIKAVSGETGKASRKVVKNLTVKAKKAKRG